MVCLIFRRPYGLLKNHIQSQWQSQRGDHRSTEEIFHFFMFSELTVQIKFALLLIYSIVCN